MPIVAAEPPPQRTLPVGAGHREIVVEVDGQAVSRTAPLLTLQVTAQADRVAHALLGYADGDAAAGRFPLAGSETFAVGAAVRIRALDGGRDELLFDGIVTGHRLRVPEQGPALFTVACRHAAVRATLARRSAVHADRTDAEVVRALLGAAVGDDAVEVDDTAVRHAQLTQHACTDWDFALLRARAAGLSIVTRGPRLVVRAPALDDGDVRAELRHGATLLALDLEIDGIAAAQAGAQAAFWSADGQALETVDAGTPAFRPPGALDVQALADALRGAAAATDAPAAHAAPPLDAADAQARVDAELLRAGVDLAGGRATCIGLPGVQPGDTVRLAGLGSRFDGLLWVSGVRHTLGPEGWRTHVQFGGLDEPGRALRERLGAAAAAPTESAVAPVAGLQLGVVTELQDPTGGERVRVRLPMIEGDGGDGLWARLATLDAGAERGTVWRPEPGDEVLVGFIGHDPRQPVVLGALHSSAHPAPWPAGADNPVKGLRTRGGLELKLDDATGTITLATPGGRRLVLGDAAGEIVLADDAGNRLVLATPDAKLEGALNLALSAQTRLRADGPMTEITGAALLRLSGGAVQLG